MKPRVLLPALAVLAFTTPALAADDYFKTGDWLVRGRAIGVMPDENSSTSIGGTADFDSSLVPEVDFSYFFTPNIAAELILATARHDATARGTGLGDFDAGSAWVLPPTLTLQYHFTDCDWVKPYVGAGVNYTMYYAEDGGSQSSLDLHNSLGVALQGGFDVPIDDTWSWNFDVKKIYTKANAKWNGGTVTANIDLNPLIVGTGIGYRF